MMKSLLLVLAVVLVGCGKKEAIMVRPDGELVDQGNLSHHHGPPLVEMLPPIGLIGSVAVVDVPPLGKGICGLLVP